MPDDYELPLPKSLTIDQVPGEQQQFTPLIHTPGMQVAHDRFRLRLLRQWLAHSGVAYVAALLLDEHRIGTVGDDATGDGTDLLLNDPAGAAAWTAYVAASRYHGRHITEQRLLEALADEMFMAAAVAVEAGMGNTLLRLVDDTGTTRVLRPIAAPPSRDDIEQAITERTTSGQWRIWTGHAWAALPAAPASDGR
ncbi:hypothetical protein [Actinoplanes sp. NPDC026623]|uniref:hypothetical protein n=1 Tax=Actinoplanes sp. NPDC026623 TaxID=3155610 RepID=UPI0033E5298D